ncbi:MAG: hypothetical protein C0619_01105 [Desulfuromonas sp.]|nr:MAG: hypothetical protein C0619_01105 [Desulfuromonas sp.]
MLKKILPFFILLLVVGPVSAIAADPAGAAAEPSSAVVSRVVELGSDTYRGVVATARLEIPQQSGTSGSGEAVVCQLLLNFSSAASGQPLTEGDVAVKVGETDRRLADPVRLNPIDGGFRAEVTIARGGEALLKIGSRLDDDKKRIYRFYAQL